MHNLSRLTAFDNQTHFAAQAVIKQAVLKLMFFDRSNFWTASIKPIMPELTKSSKEMLIGPPVDPKAPAHAGQDPCFHAFRAVTGFR